MAIIHCDYTPLRPFLWSAGHGLRREVLAPRPRLLRPSLFAIACSIAFLSGMHFWAVRVAARRELVIRQVEVRPTPWMCETMQGVWQRCRWETP